MWRRVNFLPHLSGLAHLPGVPDLHVNRPLFCCIAWEIWSLGYSIPEGHFHMCRWTGYGFSESFSLRTQTYLRSSDVCVRRLWVSLRKADVSPRSSPLRDVSQGGTSATQRQKFHTDDVNRCLYNKSGIYGVPNINLTNFTCFLVNFGKVLCLSANELQQNSNASSREDYIPQILAVLFEILRVYIWPLWPFVCHS